MKCLDCLHRFISKIPNQLELNKLYEIDSPLVFGGTIHELNQKDTVENHSKTRALKKKQNYP